MIEEDGVVRAIWRYVRQTVKRFGVDVVVEKSEGKTYYVLDLFNEQALDAIDSVFDISGVRIIKYMYRYEEYNLYVFYAGNTLLFFVVDGNAGGCAVVNSRVWDQNFVGI